VPCVEYYNGTVHSPYFSVIDSSFAVDWRLAPLVVFVKHWAKVQGINDASHGTISSYSLVLMIIHYLQCKYNVVWFFLLWYK